ncbi:MAG: hypothetical protein IJM88_02865 [Bacteroidales bacterium]|nr:hypothetical protein [Bacteroidales bacterium]
MKRVLVLVVLSLMVSVAMAQKPATVPKKAAPAKSATSAKKTTQSNQTQQGFVDLGLPSGTLWKSSNEKGYFTYDQAMSRFGNKVPTKWQWQELISNCEWTWIGGCYKVVGKNGKSILLQACGRIDDEGDLDRNDCGFYCSSTLYNEDHTWRLGFSWNEVDVDWHDRNFGRTVRLVSY